MNRGLTVTALARTDLWEIRDYLDRTAGTQTAVRVVNTLYDEMVSLSTGATVGHPRLDLASPPLLFRLVFRYFIVYRVEPADLVVLRVLHSSRNIASMNI